MLNKRDSVKNLNSVTRSFRDVVKSRIESYVNKTFKSKLTIVELKLMKKLYITELDFILFMNNKINNVYDVSIFNIEEIEEFNFTNNFELTEMVLNRVSNYFSSNN